jgi:hypothetical protein
MTPTDPTPLDPDELITNRRLGATISALADTTGHPDRSAADLDQRERRAIRQPLNRSSHSPVAHSLLEQWDQLADDDRTAGLLLLAQLTGSPRLSRRTGRGAGR